VPCPISVKSFKGGLKKTCSDCTKITLKEKNIVERRIAEMVDKLYCPKFEADSLSLSFQKLIWMLAQRSHEKFHNSYYFKILGID